MPASHRSASDTAKLYTPRLLSLSASLAQYPLTPDLQRRSEARSQTCGSVIELGLELDGAGRLAKLGMLVSACAIGQGSAAIMARAAAGRDARDMAAMVPAIEAWLSGQGALPDWPGFDALAAAQPYSGRHGALLLPWQAMRQALSA